MAKLCIAFVLAFCCFVSVSSTSCDVSASMGFTARNFPTTANCGADDKFEVCKAIVKAWATSSGKENHFTDILGVLSAGSVPKAKEALQKIFTSYCEIRKCNQDCVANAAKTCSVSSPKVPPACDNTFISGITDAMGKAEIAKCFKGSKGRTLLEKLSKEMRDLAKRIERSIKTQENVSKDSKLAKEEREKVRKNIKEIVCKATRAVLKSVGQIFRRNRKQNCGKQTMMVIYRLFMMNIPNLSPDCKVPQPSSLEDTKQKGNPSDRTRINLFIFGLAHFKFFDQDKIDTCEDFDDGEDVTLYKSDNIEITGKFNKLKETSARYLSEVNVEFRDSEGETIDSVMYTKGNKGEMPEKFKSNKKKIDKRENGKDGGSTRGEIKLEKKNGKSFVKDLNSGAGVIIRKFVVNGSEPIIYNVFIRMPNATASESSGFLVTGCMNKKDISSSKKRRRRSATISTVEQGKYDAAVTKDPKATSMAAGVTEDGAELEAEDKTYNGGHSGGHTSKAIGWFSLCMLTIIVFLSS